MNNPIPPTTVTAAETDAHYLFFERLRRSDPKAILELKIRLTPVMQATFMSKGVQPEDLEEIINDAMLICLRKIQDGSCRFMNCDPAAYTAAVARRLVANHLRKRRLPTEALEETHAAADIDAHRHLERKEQERWLHELLDELGDAGARVIRLHYLEGFRDEEIIRQKWTPYTTVNSLKTKRCSFMKKLAQLAGPAAPGFLD